ncbi:hypothetical protein M9H77_29003 [Catharanthus roseus]|uniref:Uncharacterized protein n=1 Tax=Catharanthus roseus TaxID=4058 RepID=A0ACC0AIJ7_CATRO|nr:hypothetical protein M9H77_29003 [Catharanthus roseus]
MAIDMSTENNSTSPRISFSHDLCQKDDSERKEEDKGSRKDSTLLDFSDEFNFCISNSSLESSETSSAEELFSNGLIRTVQFQEKLVPSSKNHPISKNHHSLPPLIPTNGISISTDLAEQKNHHHQQQQQPTKSFWNIKRSTSLHCDNKKSSFWSLPLLSRSNSTGSVSNSKQNIKENHKQNANFKQQRKNSEGNSFYVYPLSQKPPLRKNFLGPNNGNGLRINPVLNVPAPHISKGTANLLGLGSFFGNGKEKKIKK